MRHLGHPTSIMDVASGLLEYLRVSSWLISDDKHELGGDVGDTTVADRPGDSTLGFTLGGERFSFRSSFGMLPFLRLIFGVLYHTCRNKTQTERLVKKQERVL